MTKVANYTVETTAQAVSMYNDLGNEGMDAIAEALNRSVRSVRSKLVREGVYVPIVKPEKAKREEGPTKKEMLNELESLATFNVDGFMGATKPALQSLIDYLKA